MVDLGDPSEGWNVHLSVSDDEAGDLLTASAGIVDERGASLVASPNSELKELVLHTREDEKERARDAVIDVYQRLRRVAGLDAEPARVVALTRPSGKGKSRHRPDVILMQEANRVLNSESHLEWAVVRAQTACEVYVRDILYRRAAELGDAAIDFVEKLPGSNLDNPTVRTAFHRLSGYTPPQETEWWRDYQAHVQRRHQIVHGGARVTRKDAESSIRAAEAMIAFLHWPA
jgi:hypothetical protein